MVFCFKCGTKLIENGKYCHNCGLVAAKQDSSGPSTSKFASQGLTPGPSTSNASQGLTSFEAYRKKEEDRCSRFKSPKTTGSKKAKLSQEAKVQVGLVCDKDGEGKLRKVKSRTIPILLDENADATTLLEKAIAKHARHFKQFDKDGSYVILYQDMTIVRNLPATSIPFTLSKYKSDLLKPYSKIYFWLCSLEDFENSTHDDDDGEGSSDDLTCLGAFDHSENDGDRSSQDKNGTSSKLTCDNLVNSQGFLTPVLPTETSFSAASTSTNNVSVGQPSNLLLSSSMGLDKGAIEKYLVPHQCPTCFCYFSRNDIEAHADVCAEGWIDPVGECEATTHLEDSESHCSMEENSGNSDDIEHSTDRLEALKAIVQTIKDNVVRPSVNRIAIRRRSAFTDYVDTSKKKWFKQERVLKITFIGEPAIDGGGPRREFFTEVLQHIKFKLFDEHGFPVINIQALANEEFKAAGEIMASSIAQDGPAPCLLSSNVYDYIVRGIASVQSYKWLDQLQDEKIKMAIAKLKRCKNDHELQTLINEETMMDILTSIGYRGIPSRENLESRDDIIRFLLITGVSKTLTMIDQLVSGLELFGVLKEVRTHREVMEILLTVEGATHFKLTADILLDHLLVEFSPDGSNRKPAEINVHKVFCDYVQEAETREDENQNGLSKLYKFVTGGNNITPLGLEKNITIKFKHGCESECKCRPTASTCDPSLTFPIHYCDSKEFEEVMDSALAESLGFGLV